MQYNGLPIKFVKNIYKETADYPKTMYLNWAPFMEDLEGPRDVPTIFKRKDPVTYIKHMTKDLWLYDINGELKWAPKHCDKEGFTFKQPQVFWVEYLEEPTFILYKVIGFGITKNKFLKYVETDKGFKLLWTDNKSEARRFSFPPGWNQGFLKERYSNQRLADSVQKEYGWKFDPNREARPQETKNQKKDIPTVDAVVPDSKNI